MLDVLTLAVVTTDSECAYNDPRAIEYMGKKQTNEENTTCIMWSDQRAYPASSFPDADLVSAENFCRNPKPFYSKSWCYSSQDAARKWGYCALRQCGRRLTSSIIDIGNIVYMYYLH